MLLNACKHRIQVLTVGHAQVKGTFVLELEVLIGKFLTVDGLSTTAIEHGKVATEEIDIIFHVRQSVFSNKFI
jgi:hypothetical protein